MTTLLLAFLLLQADRILIDGNVWPSTPALHCPMEKSPVNVCVGYTARFCDVTMGSRSSYFELMQDIRPDGRVLRYTYGAGDLPWKRDHDTWEEYFVTKQEGWAAWHDSEGNETFQIPADVHFVARPRHCEICPLFDLRARTKSTVVKTHTEGKH